MNKLLYIIAIVLALNSCSKQEQPKETSFTCTVEDITTGTMTENAHLFLYEYHTPSRPFSGLSRELVESFEVSFGESFTYEFNAKRGVNYTYILEFEDESWFESSLGVIVDGNYELGYEVIDKCTLNKKENNTCELKIEPTARVDLYADNPLPDAEETDSIWMELTDGRVIVARSCSGRGGCTRGGVEIPHGQYNFKYQIFRNGQLDEEVSYPLYIRHKLDTIISVQF